MSNKQKITRKDIPTSERCVRFEYRGIKGWLYYLATRIDDKGKYALENKYGNVRFMIAQSQYAPEQKKQCLFVGDVCF